MMRNQTISHRKINKVCGIKKLSEPESDNTWILHLDSTSTVGDIHVFHARCNTFENMLCNK